jgi:hypothetical protein
MAIHEWHHISRKGPDGIKNAVLPLLPFQRAYFNNALTFPAGLDHERGYLLFYLLAFTFRTRNFYLFMFSETLYQGKLFPAGFAEVLISRHVLPSISGLFIAIFLSVF